MISTWKDLSKLILQELEQIHSRMAALDTAVANIAIKEAQGSTKSDTDIENLKTNFAEAQNSLKDLAKTVSESSGIKDRVISVEKDVDELSKETQQQGKDITRFNLLYKIAIAVLTAALIALSTTQIKSCSSASQQYFKSPVQQDK